MASRPQVVARPWRQAVRRTLADVQRRDWLFAGLPLAVFAGLFVVCIALGADRSISRPFYDAEANVWPLKHTEPFAWCYRHGCLPALVLGIAGLAIATSARFWPRLQPAKQPGLFLALTLALGPGLLVNALLKPNVARPRPHQIDEFGGEQSFAFAGSVEPGSRSFPSGHASMGFFFMTPALLLYRRAPRLAVCVFVAGLGYGGLISFARIVQGAHFASDVLASALLVWSSAVAVIVLGTIMARLSDLADEEQTAAEPPTILAMPSSEDLEETEQRRAA